MKIVVVRCLYFLILTILAFSTALALAELLGRFVANHFGANVSDAPGSTLMSLLTLGMGMWLLPLYWTASELLLYKIGWRSEARINGPEPLPGAKISAT